MRKIVSCLLVVSLLMATGCQKDPKGRSTEELSGTISMSGAWALYPMVVKWAEEFQRIHPQVKIDVSAGGAGKGMADCLAQAVDLGMVSRDIYPVEVQKGAWWVSVTKDAVVPTVNKNNPVLDTLLTKGVKRETLINIWVTGKVENWGQVTGDQAGDQIHVYTRSDACGAAQTWAKFLDKNQENLLGVGVYGDPGLAEAVKKDTLGIGFNNINYAYDSKTEKEVEQIKVLPIDLNNNDQIDEDENFYDSRDKIANAIAAGKYPSPPARPLYLVSQGKPERKIVLEFIKWILADGQKYVSESGYINLTEEKISQELEKLEE
ncbi:MAG: PstS family phosphate ABC transporter substrate-binding protein [Sedimentisphaerales bacterium]|nr:PstS family phosphate ABC transporter substrate-binding protein [Sedimentisphaerales bacterium]